MKKIATIAVLAAVGVTTVSAVNTQVCAGCHGANFEKKAMNVSKIVKDMSKEDIVKALHGYKNGTYGGSMKGVMAGQVKSLSDDDIEAIATKIAGNGAKPAETDTTKDVAKGDMESATSRATDMAKEMAEKAVDTAANEAKEAAAGMLK